MTSEAPANVIQLAPHQERIVARCRELDGCLAVLAAPRTGKTRATLAYLAERGCKRILVVGPSIAAGVWRAEARLIGFDLPVMVALEGDLTRRAKQLSSWMELHPSSMIVTNYQSWWREKIGPLLRAWQPDAIVADECVPKGTRIATPEGDRLIDSLKIGERVFGYDHRTNTVVETVVRSIMQRQTSEPLVSTVSVQTTPNHPIWTEEFGYISAQELRHRDSTVICLEPNYGFQALSKNVRVVQRALYRKKAPKILLQAVRRIFCWPKEWSEARGLAYGSLAGSKISKPDYRKSHSELWKAQAARAAQLPNLRNRFRSLTQCPSTAILRYYLPSAILGSYASTHLRMVWKEICWGVRSKVLQPFVQRTLAYGTAWGTSEAGNRTTATEFAEGSRTALARPGMGSARNSSLVYDFASSESRSKKKSFGIQSGQRMEGTKWRERKASTGSSAFTCATDVLCSGMGSSYWHEWKRLSIELQSRLCLAWNKAWRRSRREQPSKLQFSEARSKESQVPREPRMDNSSILELGGSESDRIGRKHDTTRHAIPVFNIETGTGNYFANGVLVHNCTALKGRATRQSKFAASIAQQKSVQCRIGLTGTPITSAVPAQDLFGIFRFIRPELFGLSWTAFAREFLEFGFWGEVSGSRNDEEIKRRLQSASIEVDLPHDWGGIPKYQTWPVILTEQSTKRYREFAKSLVVEVEGRTETGERMRGLVSADLVITQAMRLHQMTSGHTKIDGVLVDISDEKITTAVELAQQTIDNGEQVVLFAAFRREIARITERLHNLYPGKVASIQGGDNPERRYDDITRFQQGQLRALVIQTHVGSMAIDLACASLAIVVSMNDSLEDFIQLRERLRGIDHTRHYNYIYLQAELPNGRATVDAAIYGRHRDKQQGASRFVTLDYARSFLGV